MTQLNNCPNCNSEIKSGKFFNSNALISIQKIKAINAFTDNNATAYCEKCSPALLQKYLGVKNSKIAPLEEEFKRLIPYLPIVTLQHPNNWDYKVLKMVTAQSITGTGVISEISSSWSDLLGGQSDRLTNKLQSGENICKNKLRVEASLVGANAIIGTDIDYAEVGGDKGMLMVCMAGTAVQLLNFEVLESSCAEAIIGIEKIVPQIRELRKHDAVFNTYL